MNIKAISSRFVLILFFVGTYSLKAQNTFQHSYGTATDETPMSFIQTLDKGFFMLGSTSGGLEYMVKTDSLGNKVWSKEFSIGISSYTPGSFIQTKDSGYLVCNSYNSSVFKTDQFGNMQWARTFSVSSVKAIEVNGGYIIGGGGRSIMKIDTLGNTVWVSNTLANYDIVLDFTFSNYDSCFYVFSASGRITKLNKNGIGIWAKYLYINNIKYTNSGGVQNITTFPGGKLLGILLGYPSNRVIAFDTCGTLHWNLTPKTPIDTWVCNMNNNNLLFAMPDSDNYYLPGGIGNCYLFKTDTTGTIKWSRKIGGPKTGIPVGIIQTKDHGIAILSSTQNYTAGADDFYLLKTDSVGKSTCNSDTITINNLISLNIKLDTCNYPFIAGKTPTDSVIFLAPNSIKDTSLNTCLCYPPHASFSYIQYTGWLLDSSTWATKWYWSFGNGTYDSTQISPQLSYSDTGKYTVCLIVKNSCGTDTNCQNIDYQLPTLGLPNIANINKTTVFPNPFTFTSTV